VSHLPHYLRQLPYVFYALAVVLFVWSLANQWLALTAMENFSYSVYEDVPTFQKSSALYGAVAEAAYMAANGAMLQILIAIFDKMKGPGA
jgi:hypothetical protein